MKQTIILSVFPRSSKNEVIEESEGVYKIKTTASPVDGEANKRVIRLLSDFLDIPKSQIQILKGKRGRKKIVEIEK